jgi:hypothetical protein
MTNQTATFTDELGLDLKVQYSTDGTIFTDAPTNPDYDVLANGGSPNSAWNMNTSSTAYSYSYDFSSIAGLNNQSSIYFRLLDTSGTSATGGTVGSSGTDRVDNVIIRGSTIPSPVPLPPAALAGAALMGSMLVGKRLRRGESQG